MIDTRIIDGKGIAAELRTKITTLVKELDIIPGLAVILVGNNPASEVYVRNKAKATRAVGFNGFEYSLPIATTENDLLTLINQLNNDKNIDGILVQLPLPNHINTSHILEAIDPSKDVDGFHPVNVGRLWSGGQGLIPCTPYGCLMLLRSTGIKLIGANAAIINHSNIVGKPLAALLLREDSSVTVLHAKSQNIQSITRQADILVSATGCPGLIRRDWIKPGAIVIDVGITRILMEDGKTRLVGDVAFDEAYGIAGAITPVPGGVGPMTIACLLRNTLIAACRRCGLKEPGI
jgi:methylenetetrahydrofolate dehydrogenase (NADP+)/methenyltetrahydrofolate cyclohydrolase